MWEAEVEEGESEANWPGVETQKKVCVCVSLLFLYVQFSGVMHPHLLCKSDLQNLFTEEIRKSVPIK